MKKLNPLEIVPGLRDLSIFVLSYASETILEAADEIACEVGAGDFKSLILMFAVNETEGTLSQADLAHILRVNANSMVQRMDRLEKSGLLKRVRREDNRRTYNVMLTSKAKEILQNFKDRKSNIPFGTLGSEEVETLKKFCGSIIDNKFVTAALCFGISARCLLSAT